MPSDRNGADRRRAAFSIVLSARWRPTTDKPYRPFPGALPTSPDAQVGTRVERDEVVRAARSTPTALFSQRDATLMSDESAIITTLHRARSFALAEPLTPCTLKVSREGAKWLATTRRRHMKMLAADADFAPARAISTKCRHAAMLPGGTRRRGFLISRLDASQNARPTYAFVDDARRHTTAHMPLAVAAGFGPPRSPRKRCCRRHHYVAFTLPSGDDWFRRQEHFVTPGAIVLKRPSRRASRHEVMLLG